MADDQRESDAETVTDTESADDSRTGVAEDTDAGTTDDADVGLTDDADAGTTDDTSTGETADREKGTAELDAELEAMDVDAGGGTAVPGEAYCSSCGASIAANAEICPECGVRQSSSSRKDPGIAAILSVLFPGAGNLYLGQMERGIAILLGWVVWIVVGWFFGGFIVIPIISVFTFGLGLILFIIPVMVEFLIHVLAAYDAYNQGERIAEGKREVR